MTTSIFPSNFNDEYSYNIINNKFVPKLKLQNSINLPYNNNENNSFINNTDKKVKNKESYKFNKLCFLFPSKPIDVKNNILYNIYYFHIFILQKIEGIVQNENISIEEGIEKLKELTISEKNKNEKNITVFNKRNILNSSKFQNNYKKKRNYISLFNTSNQNVDNQEDQIKFGAQIKAPPLFADNESQNKKSKIINPLNLKIEKKLNEENKTTKVKEKMELKNVDIIAQELVQKKNENELKEYLFDQLQLLDYKKRNDQNLLNIKNSIILLMPP